MNRFDPRLPSQLCVVGATDLERRLLNAGARELPSVELTRRMQQGLGISLVAGAATAASAATAKAATAAGAGAATPAVAWPVISIGVLALAVTGAVVGVRSTASHHASTRAPMVLPVASPTATLVAVETPPAAEPVEAPAPARIEHRAAVHHHATVAASQSDLRAEIALVDAARSAVGASANGRALALLDRYQASYPHGTFRPEVAALRIEALDHLGRVAQARALARRFIAVHADSPLADRVARVTGLAAR
ncbi:MAG TPA: hypothetical protein VGP64_02590 [Polyangia bacterium]